MTRRDVLRLMGAATAAAAVLPVAAACAPGAPVAATTAPVAATAPSAATQAAKLAENFRIAQNFDIRTWDPHRFFSSWEMTLLRHSYEPLVGLDETGKLIPMLAESWAYSADGTALTFKLRPGVQFSNGQLLTASDVKATIERIKGNALSGFAFMFVDVDGAEAPAPSTVVLRMKKPLGGLLFNLTTVNIIPAAAAQANLSINWEDGVGTGPFKPVERIKGERVVFAANANYWQKGLPKSARVTFRPILEDATRVAALRNAEIDVGNFIPPELVGDLKGDQALRVIDDKTWEVHFLGLSCTKPPFNNPKARAALNFALQRDDLVKSIYGVGEPIAAYIQPGLIGYDQTIPANPYAPAKAKDLVTESGAAGTVIDFIVPQGGFSKSATVSQAIVGQMEAVGFKVKMSVIELATWAQRRNSGDYGMYIIDTEAVTGDPDRFLTERIVRDLTKTGYKNDELFSLITQAGAELDATKRADLYKRAQRIMFDEPSSHIFLYMPVQRHVERKAVQGFTMPPTGMWLADKVTVAA